MTDLVHEVAERVQSVRLTDSEVHDVDHSVHCRFECLYEEACDLEDERAHSRECSHESEDDVYHRADCGGDDLERFPEDFHEYRSDVCLDELDEIAEELSHLLDVAAILLNLLGDSLEDVRQYVEYLYRDASDDWDGPRAAVRPS